MRSGTRCCWWPKFHPIPCRIELPQGNHNGGDKKTPRRRFHSHGRRRSLSPSGSDYILTTILLLPARHDEGLSRCAVPFDIILGSLNVERSGGVLVVVM